MRSIDRIVYAPVEGAHSLTVDESGGRFGPGASKEVGGNEIEISVKLPWAKRHRPSAVQVVGTEGSDRIRMGDLIGGRTGINLDVGRDRAHKDVDVAIESPSLVRLKIYAGDGDDRVSAAGGREFSHPLFSNGLLMRGGGGSDVLVGGPRNDHLWGEEGDDVLDGHLGNDHLSLGAGRDRAFGGPGEDSMGDGRDGEPDLLDGGAEHDSIGALNEERDTVACGSGFDQAWVDLIDLWSRADCEKLHGPGFPR